ncbi:MAG: DNA polymerase I [Thermodesulfobacteriota bacterium]
MSSKTLYLIDGSSYIFRAYFAIRHLSTSKGFPTNAIYGFASMMFKFIKDFDPEYLAVVFDTKERTFRSDIYPLYKANRDVPPDDLIPQFEKIHEVVDAFSIPIIRLDGFEADDLMGTIAKKNENKNIEIVLVTGDKDFCQLVSNNIKILDTMKNKVTDHDEVVKKFGVAPDKVIDVLALAGDQVDNIPGVKGIGEKTASKLISEFGSVEDVYQQLSQLKGKQKERLEQDRDEAFLSKQLVTIKTDVEIETDYERFKYEGFNNEKLSKLFDEFEFKNLKKELSEEKVVEDFKSSGVINYSNYKLILNEADLDAVIKKIHDTKELSVDLETTSHLPTFAEIVGISLTPSPDEGFYVPVAHNTEAEQLERDFVLEKLKPLLEDTSIRKIGQNLKYEVVVFSRYGINLDGIYFDTMLATHLLDSSRQSYKLDKLSLAFLGHTMISYEDVTKKGKTKLEFADVDIEEAKNYSCEDSDVAMKLYKILYKDLAENDLEYVYFEKVIKIVPVLAKMEINGVLIKTEFLNSLSKEFETELEKITGSIYSSVGDEFNINSPLQLRKILFEKLGLEIKKRTKTGEPSTDHEVLADLSKYHDVPALVLKYRELAKLKSTYVDSLPKLINPRTGRLHTSYNAVGTSTGRVSSSDPNLQNIPIRSPEGRRIRKAFVPDKGYLFLSADYSQIELRLLAHFSQDEKLVEAFNTNSDIHSKTASEIFSVDENKVNEDMRRLAKNINFGIIYGISPFGLSKQLGTSVSESKRYIDEYFSRYPKVKDYLEKSIREAQNRGYTITIIGRRRPIPELNSKNRMQRGIGERAAINTPIQGSAADIINLAMINIDNKLLDSDCKMILQVHDELIFEVNENKVNKYKDKIKKEMESAYQINVPIKVEIGEGHDWAEAH